MVRGFDSFKEWFSGYENEYIIIGGVACDLLMQEAEQSFRATKDLDMVLIIEAISKEFVERFWEYIKEAGYEHQNKSTGNVQFYRFSKPKDATWLPMIELFSRRPEEVFLKGEPILTPIPVDEEISSLSAILLDETYYEFLKEGKVVIDGVPVLEIKHLIPFKVKAYLDNAERKNAGERVDSRDIKKHKNDVFRLSLMFSSEEASIPLPKSMFEDVSAFIDAMTSQDVDVKSLGGVDTSKDELIQRISQIYQLTEK